MSDPTPRQDVFDIRKIRRLIQLMKDHDLSEIDLHKGETRVQIRRGGEAAVSGPRAAPVAALPVAAPLPPVAVALPAAPPAEDKNTVVIKSPMVGTFYAAPDPNSPSYVKVGDHVGPETTVCIVEAMKVFNQIPAEVAGRILAVLVGNGEPVEYGQPLFKVDTRT